MAPNQPIRHFWSHVIWVTPLHVKALLILLIQTLNYHQSYYICPIISQYPLLDRAVLVDEQFILGQWQPHSSHSSQIDSPDGCVTGWVGCLLSRQNNQRKVVTGKSGTYPSRQSTGSERSILAPQYFLRD